MQTNISARWHLAGGTLVTPEGVLRRGNCTILGSKIQKISTQKPRRRPGDTFYNAGGHYVIPGLIDLHVNGVGCCDLSRDPAKSLAAFSLAMARRGVTSFLPALISAPFSQLLRTLRGLGPAWRQKFPGARALGIHLEGPFLNPLRRGAHPMGAIQPPSVEKAKKLLAAGEGLVKMMTVAPEKDRGGQLLNFLRRRGVLPALGHSDATYSQGLEAMARGYCYATHLFNAMRPWHHREPGLAQAALDSPEIFAELICDGVHLAYPVLEMALRLKSSDHLVLASDELVGIESCHLFAGQKLTRRGKCFLHAKSQTLVGGAVSLLEGIRQWSEKSKRNWLDLVPLATINPSRVLRISRWTGSLEAGKAADLVILTPDLKVQMTVVAGKIVYQHP